MPTAGERIAIGLMAGTSGDGVDAAAVRIHGVGEGMRVELMVHVHRPFARALQRRLMAVMAPAATRTEEIARLDADLGEAFAAGALLAMKALPRKERPDVIGLAGQTVCHLPGRQGRTVTLQLGQAARVAERTGVLTVSDFRQSDVAAGGFGAPLVPWTDWVLFRHARWIRFVQNIGGIGNVTCIPAGGRAEDVIAFDTGPGNMVIDGLVTRITDGRERMDRGGRRAARGRVLDGVLARWMGHPFLRARPPKTTGREEFGAPFLDLEMTRLQRASSSPDDWVSTATAFTAETIAESYRRFLGKPLKSGEAGAELIVCGGGSQNPTLLRMLAERLPAMAVRRIDEYGIPAGAKEAVSFAMLAVACLDGVPGNLPQVTGARRPAMLGRVTGWLSAGASAGSKKPLKPGNRCL